MRERDDDEILLSAICQIRHVGNLALLYKSTDELLIKLAQYDPSSLVFYV